MTDQELRTLVRDAIARRGLAMPAQTPLGRESALPIGFRGHASHGFLPVLRGSDGDGVCLIEPTVRCNQCGYCQSYGH